MNKVIRITGGLMLMFFFKGCSDNPQDTSGGTRLAKYTEYDDPLDFASDIFSYDAEGRVSAINESPTHLIATFFYTGIDTKPFKMNGEANETTHFFNYSNDGKLLRDSSISIFNQYINVTDYSYPGNSIATSRSRQQQIATGIWIERERDTFYLDNTGRINETRVYNDFFSGTGILKLNKIITYNYDNKINPLYNLNIGFLNRYGLVPVETLLDYHHFQANNCTRKQSIHFDQNGNQSGTETEIYNCLYYSNNYIKEFSYQWGPNPDDIIKDVFTYE